GIGGMASVYAATHRNGNEFAVKMLHPELSMRADLRTRFLREGHAAGSVKHPGAVQILDDDVAEDGSAFLVMELLRGESIEILWERRQQHLPIKLVVGIGIQLLDVLEAAHARGVIHRDIKPANIFLTNTGHVKVLDFGIARIRDMAASHATQTGMMMGTPAFMAPEQAMAKTSEIDAQTDVWSAGATMFTLASGRLVHEAENAQQIMIFAATTPAPTLASVLPDSPSLVAEVIDRALAFHKAERWGNARAMREALGTAAKAAFGSVPTPDTLAEIIEDLGEEATVVQQFDLPPPHPGLQHHAVSLHTKDIIAPVESDASEPATTQRLAVTPPGVPILGAPPTELATAQPVWRDGPRKSLPLWGLRPTPAIALGSMAAAIVVGVLIGLFMFLGRSTSKVQPSVSATSATVMSTAVPQPSLSAAQPEPSAALSAASATAPVASVEDFQIDSLQAASTTTAPSAPNPPPIALPAPPRGKTTKPSCDPPYYFDGQGTKHFKRECLSK
ncbi:MAG: serine/threonine-protein kinase, partial [Polyangiaceae bacterium]